MAETLNRPEYDELYERDFFAWTQQQAEKLRTRSHNDIDWETVAEEIESLGRSDKREIRSRIGVILLHLLKWEHQPEQRGTSWLGTLREQRHQVEKLLRESPSLQNVPSEAIADEYAYARLNAADETGLPLGTFPVECRYSSEEILSQDFLPGRPWSRDDARRN